METRLAKDLPEFNGDLSQEGLQFWKTAFSAMTHPGSSHEFGVEAFETAEGGVAQPGPSTSAGDQKVVLLPCRSAPSRERVEVWLQARRQYEHLQKGRRGARERRRTEGAGEETSARTEPAGRREPDLRKEEGSERLARTRSERGGVSLHVFPVGEAETQDSPMGSEPVTDPGAQDLALQDPREEQRYGQAVSPDSPDLPPWQQTEQPSPSGEGGGPGLEPPSPDRGEERQFLSPSPLPLSREGGRISPGLLHSTPVLRRCRSSSQPVCSTPVTDGKPALHPLRKFISSHRRLNLHLNRSLLPPVYRRPVANYISDSAHLLRLPRASFKLNFLTSKCEIVMGRH